MFHFFANSDKIRDSGSAPIKVVTEQQADFQGDVHLEVNASILFIDKMQGIFGFLGLREEIRKRYISYQQVFSCYALKCSQLLKQVFQSAFEAFNPQ